MTGVRVYIPPLTVWLFAGLFGWLALFPPNEKTNSLAAQDNFGNKASGATAAPEINFSIPYTADYETRQEMLKDKPLFSETRSNVQNAPQSELPTPLAVSVPQPKPKASEPVAKPRPFLPVLEFRGYVRRGDDLRVLLSLPTTAEERWVRAGDRLLEWNVADVSKRMVRLESGEFQHIVETNKRTTVDKDVK